MIANAVTESLSGLTSFALHFVAAVALVALFCFVYVRVTPYAEFRLIREGKVAPAISFCGALFGFILPLSSAIVNSVSFVDMVVWAMVALVVQILVFLVLKAMFSQLAEDISEDKTAPAILLGAMSTAAGLLNAACMYYSP
jgi:putative membrane protein